MADDHFSSVAQQYAQSRPTYPDALFGWLASCCAAHELAWDVGAGNGQASLALAGHFARVLATDLSAEQIAQAPTHERIEYRVAPAERSGLPEHGTDLVTVAQALHWFDLDPFYREVRRVLKPTGVFAAWSYGVLELDDPVVDAAVQHFYREVAGPHWPAGRRHVENGYADLAFPFKPLPPPPLWIRLQWDLAAFLGYVRSWSATARLRSQAGDAPLLAFEQQLAAAWGDPAAPREVRWPITMRAGTL
jgi:ubiquinone/menaquinone biosynthesis C-methylase UbiE